MPKFRVIEGYIFEDTGDRRKDRLIIKVMSTGALEVGPGLGKEAENLFNVVPEDLIDQAIQFVKKRS